MIARAALWVVCAFVSSLFGCGLNKATAALAFFMDDS